MKKLVIFRYARVYNPRTWEAEAGRSQVQDIITKISKQVKHCVVIHLLKRSLYNTRREPQYNPQVSGDYAVPPEIHWWENNLTMWNLCTFCSMLLNLSQFHKLKSVFTNELVPFSFLTLRTGPRRNLGHATPALCHAATPPLPPSQCF